MIPEMEQQETDFDWFGVDEDGSVGHFTTAGFKYLPKSVAVNGEDLKKVTDYFKRLPPGDHGYLVEDGFAKETAFEDDGERTRYLSCFTEMAQRGLYSFDIDTY